MANFIMAVTYRLECVTLAKAPIPKVAYLAPVDQRDNLIEFANAIAKKYSKKGSTYIIAPLECKPKNAYLFSQTTITGEEFYLSVSFDDVFSRLCQYFDTGDTFHITASDHVSFMNYIYHASTKHEAAAGLATQQEMADATRPIVEEFAE